MMVWRNSVTCMPEERADLRKALYFFITEGLDKEDPERKKFLRYYKAFRNADERQKEDSKGN